MNYNLRKRKRSNEKFEQEKFEEEKFEEEKNEEEYLEEEKNEQEKNEEEYLEKRKEDYKRLTEILIELEGIIKNRIESVTKNKREEYDSDLDSDYNIEEEEERIKEEDEIIDEEIIEEEEEDEENLLKRIINSKMSEKNKSALIIKYKDIKPISFEEQIKYIKGVLEIPWGEYKNNYKNAEGELPNEEEIEKILINAKQNLDEKVLYMENAKEAIIHTLHSELKGKNSNLCLAFHGEPGLGKTTLALEGVARALGRPLRIISLGGITDVKFLKGTDSVYFGSGPGRIVEILKETECMNPIIYFDEVDKVGINASHGIYGMLTHLLDPVQSKHYCDNYYKEIDIDLSKVSFICSFNNIEMIDSVVLDRMEVIHIKTLNKEEMIKVAKKIILPELLKKYSFGKTLIFKKGTIKQIINKNNEQGMREFKRNIKKVLDRILILCTTNKLNYKYMKSEKINEMISKEKIEITCEVIDILLESDEIENDSFLGLYT